VVAAIHEAGRSPQQVGHAELDLYLALLHDRLPVYVAALSQHLTPGGQASVAETLVRVVRATMDFHGDVLPAKISVMAEPAGRARFRQAMRPHEIGPHRTEQTIAEYLRRERENGRVATDVDPVAIARILIASSLDYTLTSMLDGSALPAREDYAADTVRALRLGP
jgi:hypothetical protein